MTVRLSEGVCGRLDVAADRPGGGKSMLVEVALEHFLAGITRDNRHEEMDWGPPSPITSRVRDYPFEAMLPESASLRGVVLADQPRSISWEKRPIKHAGRAPDILLTDVRERLAALLGIE